MVFVGSGTGNLQAFDPQIGVQRWKFGTGSAILSSATVAKALFM